MTDAERIEVLALAYALLDGAPWYHGAGTALIGGVPAADALCGLTALSRAFFETQGRLGRHAEADYDQLRHVVERGVPGGDSLPRYNDAPGRRQRDVLRLYEKAAAKIGK